LAIPEQINDKIRSAAMNWLK